MGEAAALGDVTSEFPLLVSAWKARQVFRIGRIRLPMSASSPASTRVTVQNSGLVAWPETTVLANVEGESMGVPVMPLGSLEPGKTADVEIDLQVKSGTTEACSETRSLWAITEAATGIRLGPLLVFEVVWDPAC